MLGDAVRRRPRLVPISLAFLCMPGVVTGRLDMIGGVIDRLDLAWVEKLEAAFGWRPVERIPKSLAFLVEEFNST